MKYQDRTFCTGGSPCCAHFSKCPKALTAEHQSQAKFAGLQVAQFISPTSMPCYIDPTAPKLEIVAKPKEKPALKRETKFFISSVPEKRWRQLFNSKPIQIAS